MNNLSSKILASVTKNKPSKRKNFFSGIIFTSPRSVKAVQIALQLDDYSNLHKWAELTAFVVGETTKKDAKALGFSTLNYTYGSVLQLTDLMRWCRYLLFFINKL